MIDISLDFLPTLQSGEVTPAQFIAAARAYKGLGYSAQGTFAAESLESGDVFGGKCDCVGLFLLAARRCGLLPRSFDPNLPPCLTGMSRENALIEILTRNFGRVDVLAARPGDLLQIWMDGAREAKHIALLTSFEPSPYGSMIHACDDKTGNGRVWEMPVDGYTRGQIHRVYRLNRWIVGGAHG